MGVGCLAVAWWTGPQVRDPELTFVDYRTPGKLRGYARFDAARLAPGMDSGALLGRGHLAMTIDQGADMSRYQGLVALEGGGFEAAARFCQPYANYSSRHRISFDSDNSRGSPAALAR